MKKNTMLGVALAMVLGLSLAGCEDTKARQENEQLKAQIVQLQKDNADLTTHVDGLTKDNAALAEENARLKARLTPAKKTTKKGKRHHKRATS